MNYKSEYSKRARKEFFDSWYWYEEQQLFLGDEFKKAIDEQIALIEKYPERFPERRKYFRESKVKVFPFLVIYRVIKKKKNYH